MKKFRVLFIIMIAMMSLMVSCGEKSKVIEEVIEKKWVEDMHFFRESKILLNSGISDDKLIVVGINNYTTFENNDDSPLPSHQMSRAPKSLDHKPVIHNKKGIVAHAIDSIEYKYTDFMFESSLFSGSSSPTIKYFNLDKIDEYSKYSYLSSVKSYKYEFGAFNNQNQFLVVMNDKYLSENTGYVYTTSFALIDLNIDDDIFHDSERYLIMDPKVKRIEVPSGYGSRKPYLIYSFNGYFFIKFIDGSSVERNSLWRVSPTGEIIELLDYTHPVAAMFDFNNILYRLFNQKIHKSLDNGLTWEYAGPAPFQFGWANFFEVAGVLYCYIYSQIFIVDIRENAQDWKELDNSGLEGYEITSVTEFQDRVYITTLSGLFYKSIEDFLTPKKEVVED